MIWEVTSAPAGDVESLLTVGWEPFAVQRMVMWFRREKRQVTDGSRVDPSTTCHGCGERLGYGHADDCPRMPELLALEPDPEVAGQTKVGVNILLQAQTEYSKYDITTVTS